MIVNEKLKKEVEKQGFTEEQKEWLLDKFARSILFAGGYKIRLGEKVLCYKSEFKGMNFYKILIVKKNQDGEKIKAYKNVKFVNCEPPKLDNAEIVIDSMFEDFYFKPNDKYNAIFTLVICAYHYPEDSGAFTYDQISQYKDNVDYLTDNSFEIIGEPVNTIDEELPF